MSKQNLESVKHLNDAVASISKAMSEFYNSFSEEEIYSLIQCNRKIQKIAKDKKQLTIL